MIRQNSIFNRVRFNTGSWKPVLDKTRRCSREDQQGGLLVQMAQISTTAWLLTLVSFHNLYSESTYPPSSHLCKFYLTFICNQTYLLVYDLCIIHLVSLNFRVSKSSWWEISSLRSYSHSGTLISIMFWHCNVYRAVLSIKGFQFFIVWKCNSE